jgi:TatD DNase family protein
MRFTDSHCHLNMADSSALLDRAREGGVRGFVVPATKLDDAPVVVALAQQHDDVWSAVGFHPHETKDCDDAAFAEIARLAREPRVVAIGEMGLDYHYMHSPRETQREVFVRHVALARELDLPLIIHNRESTEDLLDLVRSDVMQGSRGILHSYTENATVAKELVERGFYISFSGIVTFRTADMLREAAAALPHDRVLIETDTPYLAPVPHRGKQNEPAFVVKVAELLASVWNVSLEVVADATTANFERAFSVKLPR